MTIRRDNLERKFGNEVKTLASESKTYSDESTARTVVVAEDEALIRLDTVEALEDAGYEVVGQAASGQEAVDLTREYKPDVVIMDVKMPGKDGIEAATEIGQENLAPVVMLTAFSQQGLVEKAADAGALAYVVKPFAPEKLLPAIEVAISRFEQINALKDEVTDMKARFEARKRVDRAKGLLMENMGLTESEAFRWIQKTSMDRRLTMQEVADAVITQVQGDN
ncbi:response regulator receiver and ANTAR domain-containing protein [Bombiscardovia coagulans]|uniref:Response regulator receiver and ANTAR domain-containing protein n=1 Tax=Bombiscardovia coagulans TaxID=686666 RepID=A0A261ET10_9BIFI|nr:response regulator receiver and ANTAR domain-containing protein [Bombiscardovia coagulans]